MTRIKGEVAVKIIKHCSANKVHWHVGLHVSQTIVIGLKQLPAFTTTYLTPVNVSMQKSS